MLDLPADFDDDTARRRSRSRSPPATRTAPTSPGAPTARSSRSSRRGTRGPTSTSSATSTRSGPTARGLRRVTGSRGDCALPGLRRRTARLYVTAVPDLGPDGLDFVGPAGGALPGGRRPAVRCAAARPGAAPPRRRDAGDGRRRRRRPGRRPAARARWSCCGCRWTAGRPRRWSTGRSPCAASPPAAASSSPPWRTTGRPAS